MVNYLKSILTLGIVTLTIIGIDIGPQISTLPMSAVNAQVCSIILGFSIKILAAAMPPFAHYGIQFSIILLVTTGYSVTLLSKMVFAELEVIEWAHFHTHTFVMPQNSGRKHTQRYYTIDIYFLPFKKVGTIYHNLR